MDSLDKSAVIVVFLTVSDKFPQPIANFAVYDHLRGIRFRLVPDMF